MEAKNDRTNDKKLKPTRKYNPHQESSLMDWIYIDGSNVYIILFIEFIGSLSK